jgi:hypothetical protein
MPRKQVAYVTDGQRQLCESSLARSEICERTGFDRRRLSEFCLGSRRPTTSAKQVLEAAGIVEAGAWDRPAASVQVSRSFLRGGEAERTRDLLVAVSRLEPEALRVVAMFASTLADLLSRPTPSSWERS